MKAFTQLLNDFERAVAEEQIEAQSGLRRTHPSYYDEAKRHTEVTRKVLLAYNDKYHKPL